MNKNRRVSTFFLLLIFSWNLCFAEYRKNAYVQYKVKDGWSDQYRLEVIFAQGSELNKSTGSYKYSSYSLYALIFWNNEGSVSVIKLDGYNSCGLQANKDCIDSHFSDWEGTDQQERSWNICTGNYCPVKSGDYGYIPKYSSNENYTSQSYKSNSGTRHWINAGLIIMLVGFIVLDVGLLLYVMDEEQETPGLITMAVGGGLMTLGPLLMLGDVNSGSQHSENNFYERKKLVQSSKTFGLSFRFEF
jgi:uncharacterized membrane protein